MASLRIQDSNPQTDSRMLRLRWCLSARRCRMHTLTNLNSITGSRVSRRDCPHP
jgi:hypothetical protein